MRLDATILGIVHPKNAHGAGIRLPQRIDLTTIALSLAILNTTELTAKAVSYEYTHLYSLDAINPRYTRYADGMLKRQHRSGDALLQSG